MAHANDAVVDEVRRHHTDLAAGLRTRAEALAAADEDGRQAAERDLIGYVEAEILPHARHEEETVYRVAGRRPQLADLVHHLTAEHGQIRNLAKSTPGSDAPVARANALELASLFETHALAETEKLLAVLARDPGVDLAAILAGGNASEEDVEIDVRELPHATRHTAIFAILERLAPGQALVITNDHDPQPLRYQIEATHPGSFGWTYELEGPEAWRVAIRRR